MEEWRRLEDYQRYEVNKDGDVRSDRGILKEKQGHKGTAFRLADDTGKKHQYARRRIVWAYYTGSIERADDAFAILFDMGWTTPEICDALKVCTCTALCRLRESGRSPDKRERERRRQAADAKEAARREQAEKRKQERRDAIEAARAEREAAKASQPKPEPPKVICPVCGIEHHRATDYCSDRCKYVASRPVKTCRQCGTEFKVGGSVFCSHECSQEYKREHRVRDKYKTLNARGRAWTRRTGARYEHIEADKVFERDGYVCQICGKPTAERDGNLSPMYPTVDHVVPLSKGGDHTYGNVQTAHFICNSHKAAG